MDYRMVQKYEQLNHTKIDLYTAQTYKYLHYVMYVMDHTK